MSSRETPSAHGTGPLRGRSAGEMAATPRASNRSHKPSASKLVASVSHRTLPPPRQFQSDRTEAFRSQSDHAKLPPAHPQSSHSINEQRSASQLYASLPLDAQLQQNTSAIPTPGPISLARDPSPAYPWGTAASTSQRSADHYTGFHGPSAQDIYKRSNPHPLVGDARVGTLYSPFHGSSGSQRSSITSSSAYGSTHSQYGQPTADLGRTADSTRDITSRYRLSIRQQPLAARACGFGERDRRVIDPPPIVQLSLLDYDPNSNADVSELKYSHLVVLCTLVSASPTVSLGRDGQDVTAVPEPNNAGKLTRKMTGTLVASPFTGIDPDISASLDQNRRLGCFFIFSDLSCRQVGQYRLKFSIMKVGPESMGIGGTVPVLASVESNEFEVYSAKDFPGMKASTPLTKHLKTIGALVSVKKGHEGRPSRKGQNKRDSSPSDGSDNAKFDPKDAALRTAEKNKSR